MPLTTLFSIAQSLFSPTILTVTDASAGSDVAVTQRRVYLQKADGSYLVPAGTSTNYIQWAIANPSIDINVLARDYALSIRVDWLDVTNVVLYSKTALYVFTLNSEQFFYSLTQYQTSNPSVINDKNYYDSKVKLRCSIDEANNSTTIGNDIQSAQAALDRALYLIQNQSTLF